MIYRAYEPSDEKAWLDFMAKVQIKSDAWEALYLEKPKFHQHCDHVIIENGTILGVIAGHHIDHPEYKVYSVEILATHPDFQNKGIAKTLLAEMSDQLKSDSILTFWTKTETAKSWYEKVGLPLIDQKHQSFKSFKKHRVLNIVGNHSPTKKANLWCFACTCPAD